MSEVMEILAERVVQGMRAMERFGKKLLWTVPFPSGSARIPPIVRIRPVLLGLLVVVLILLGLLGWGCFLHDH